MYILKNLKLQGHMGDPIIQKQISTLGKPSLWQKICDRFDLTHKFQAER